MHDSISRDQLWAKLSAKHDSQVTSYVLNETMKKRGICDEDSSARHRHLVDGVAPSLARRQVKMSPTPRASAIVSSPHVEFQLTVFQLHHHHHHHLFFERKTVWVKDYWLVNVKVSFIATVRAVSAMIDM